MGEIFWNKNTLLSVRKETICLLKTIKWELGLKGWVAAKLINWWIKLPQHTIYCKLGLVCQNSVDCVLVFTILSM